MASQGCMKKYLIILISLNIILVTLNILLLAKLAFKSSEVPSKIIPAVVQNVDSNPIEDDELTQQKKNDTTMAKSSVVNSNNVDSEFPQRVAFQNALPSGEEVDVDTQAQKSKQEVEEAQREYELKANAYKQSLLNN